jgi:hypothetical protein
MPNLALNNLLINMEIISDDILSFSALYCKFGFSKYKIRITNDIKLPAAGKPY